MGTGKGETPADCSAGVVWGNGIGGSLTKARLVPSDAVPERPCWAQSGVSRGTTPGRFSGFAGDWDATRSPGGIIIIPLTVAQPRRICTAFPEWSGTDRGFAWRPVSGRVRL